MIFEKAYRELMAGKKIRRKEWEPLMHMRQVDLQIKTFKGEYTPFYEDVHSLFFYVWQVVDGDGSDIQFIDAIEELKNRKSIKRHDWIENKLEQFIFIDNGQFALCREIEFAFMPTWKCLISDDWQVMK